MTCSKQCPCASCQNVLKNVLWCIMARLCIKCSDQFCLFSKNRDGRSVQNSLRRWVLSQTRDLWCNYVNRDFVCVFLPSSVFLNWNFVRRHDQIQNYVFPKLSTSRSKNILNVQNQHFVVSKINSKWWDQRRILRNWTNF